MVSRCLSACASPPGGGEPSGMEDSRVRSDGRLTIPGPEGPLEAVFREPRARPAPAAAVCCHPHPMHGGDMNNRTIYRAARAVEAAGLATLRFNFRGVGSSAGAYDEGRGEQEDVHAAADWLRNRFPGRPLALVGFSFGAWVGLQVACRNAGIGAMVGLGLPLTLYDFDFLCGNSKPALLLSGSRDEFSPPPDLTKFAARLPRNSRLKILEGAGHLLTERMNQVESSITGFLRAWVAEECSRC
ncbi:MAG: alpha/beta fold hydrolase [Acidobacteria bacterium]|nr:alpha/beta fold hydrolase [Acidobacteriota bacterium]